jgi:hypothetical protein
MQMTLSAAWRHENIGLHEQDQKRGSHGISMDRRRHVLLRRVCDL